MTRRSDSFSNVVNDHEIIQSDIASVSVGGSASQLELDEELEVIRTSREHRCEPSSEQVPRITPELINELTNEEEDIKTYSTDQVITEDEVIDTENNQMDALDPSILQALQHESILQHQQKLEEQAILRAIVKKKFLSFVLPFDAFGESVDGPVSNTYWYSNQLVHRG